MNECIKKKKCSLVRTDVKFLGHVVGVDGIRPDPNKTKAIEALRLPNNAKELSSALGIMRYYRKFITNYASVSEPLRKKLIAPHLWRKNKNNKVEWTEKETEAFFKLRDALKGDPVLQHPNWEHPFELHTDASHSGLGAVLCQRIEGKEHVIAYASRALSKTEIPYSIWELESLAMVWATRLFSMYLYNKKFKYSQNKIIILLL